MRSLFARVIATGFGSGYLPWAPGTWGTVAALPFAIGLNQLPPGGRVGLIAAYTCLAIWAAGAHSTERKIADPKFVVSDEFAGFFITAFFVTTPLGWVVAFLSFRLFDVVKPWPARTLDRWSKTQLGKSPWALGFGIVVDDLVAGIYALITTEIIVRLVSHL